MLFLQQTAGNRAVESVRTAVDTPGRPLDPATRSVMEERFGHDLGGVRVHTDAQAAESASAIGAQAYTVGSEIAFAHDRFAPDTTEGRRLLAHEIAHTVQQRDPAAPPPSNDPASAVETSARDAADSVTAGQQIATAMPSAGVGVSMNAVSEREIAIREAEEYLAESNRREKEEEEQEKARDEYASRDRRPKTLSLLGDDSITETGLAIDEAIEGPARERKREEEDQRLQAEVQDAEGRWDRFHPIRIELEDHGRGRKRQREILGDLTARDRAILRHYGAIWPTPWTNHITSQQSIVKALDRWAEDQGVSLFTEETARASAALDRYNREWLRGSESATTLGGGIAAAIARQVTDDPAQVSNAAEFGANVSGLASVAAQTAGNRNSYVPQAEVPYTRYGRWRYTGKTPTKEADTVAKDPVSMPRVDVTQGKFFNRPEKDWSKVEPTGPSFGDVTMQLGLEAPGTVRYRSARAAARAARQSGLENAKRPGFQTHSVAGTIRNVFGISGRQYESAHIVPQAVYRRLRDMGFNVSEGRAFTTLLPKRAHNTFDGYWVARWNAAREAGERITAGDLYRWVSEAVNRVDARLMSNDLKGAINDRLRTELYSDLGLSDSFVIVPAGPPAPRQQPGP